MNLLLFVFDFIILLPITLIRLFIIYLYGSYYNIKDLEFLDILTHSKKNTNVFDKIKTETERIYKEKYKNKNNKKIFNDHTDNDNINISDQIDKIKQNIESTLSSDTFDHTFEQIPNTPTELNNNHTEITELNDFLFTEK
jgi:hypothetical protein